MQVLNVYKRCKWWMFIRYVAKQWVFICGVSGGKMELLNDDVLVIAKASSDVLLRCKGYDFPGL